MASGASSHEMSSRRFRTAAVAPDSVRSGELDADKPVIAIDQLAGKRDWPPTRSDKQLADLASDAHASLSR